MKDLQINTNTESVILVVQMQGLLSCYNAKVLLRPLLSIRKNSWTKTLIKLTPYD